MDIPSRVFEGEASHGCPTHSYIGGPQEQLTDPAMLSLLRMLGASWGVAEVAQIAGQHGYIWLLTLSILSLLRLLDCPRNKCHQQKELRCTLQGTTVGPT